MRTFKSNSHAKKSIDGKGFLSVYNHLDHKEYKIPNTQIYFSIKENVEYDFYIEYNSKLDKEFVSLIHPEFQINSEHYFKVDDIEMKQQDTLFVLKSNFSVSLKVKKLSHQTPNIEKVKCKVIKYKAGIPILANIDYKNNYYQLNNKYKFDVTGYSNFTDRKGEKVDSMVVYSKHLNLSLEVRCYDWQKEGIWTFNDIECEVIGYDKNAKPKLKIIDNRHPYYSIRDRHKFKVEKIEKSINNTTNESFFKMIVSDKNINYVVSALPNQERRIQPGDYIECEIKGIDTKVRLSQINAADPFFYRFESIVNDEILKKRHFLSIINSINDKDHIADQLKTQYNNSQGFWVFTYCNLILPKKFKEFVAKNDFVQALEINNLLYKFETWILNSGILRALHNDEERKVTKKRVNYIINDCISLNNVLKYIIDTKFDEFLNTTKNLISIKELYYFLQYSSINFIDVKKFISIISSVEINDNYFFEKIGDLIEVKKQVFLNKMNDNYFVLLTSSNINKNQIEEYKLWTYCQHLIYSSINEIQKNNLAIAKLLRYNVNLSQSTLTNIKILSYAYHTLVHNFDKPNLKFDENYNIIITELDGNPFKNETVMENWIEIENAEKNKTFLTVKVIEPHYKGYKVAYKGIIGFLPYQNITCVNLKKNIHKNINWNINVEVVISGKVFEIFTVKQLQTDDQNFLSQNINISFKPKLRTILPGIVKKIVEFGIFINTEYGDGLIHISNLCDEFDLNTSCLSYFKEGEEVFVKLLLISDDGKLEFGFKQLIGTNYESYYNKKFYENFDTNSELEENNSEVLKKKTEIEKGNIIEQYAVLEKNLKDKIKYIKLSKYFFSNINNARSYLHNIYIEYFQRLNELDEVIENYSISAYNDFSNKVQEINIIPRTLEEFPESENLVVFIKILGLFNKINEDANLALFDLVQKYTNKQDKKLLSVLSKTTFANNLMMSEVLGTDESERLKYSLKNLKVIRNYIENGVFSLAETKEDKLSRELEEKRTYWKGRINQDEGENLEFKSTLITPVPDNEKLKIIQKLEKELESLDEDRKKGIKVKIDEIKGDTAQKRIIHSAFKTICAFANTNGGVLLIGVSNDKSIYGLEKDYECFKKESEKNRDGFGKFLDAKLKSYFGDSFSSQYLKKDFLNFPEGDILIIEVKESLEEVFLLRDENDNVSPGILYVRNLSSTDKLEGIELAKFIKQRTSQRIAIAK